MRLLIFLLFSLQLAAQPLAPPVGTPLNRAHNLSDCLVGCWPMNEGGGLYAKTYVTNKNGTLTTGALFSIRQKGSAITFNGSNSYVANQNINIGTSGFTLSAWIYRTNTTAYAIFSDRTAASAVGPQFNWIDAAGPKMRLFINNSSVTATDNYPINNWTLCTITWQSGSTAVYFYSNGIKDSGSPQTLAQTPSFTAANVLAIGTQLSAVGNTPNSTFSGYMTDVKLYSRALTQTEVRQLYRDSYQMFK